MENHLANAIEQLRRGEEAGLNYIYSKTYNFVYLRAKNILKKEDDIHQLMKDVYLQLAAHAKEVERENLYEWLGKRVYMLGCLRYRKKKVREVPFLEIEKSEYNQHKSEEANDMTYVICNALEGLPDMYQATLYAFYYDYMTIVDIAEVMGYSEGAIMNRLNYTKKYIQKAMENYQEEKGQKGKMSFSVEAVCIALRKWSLDNCLGMTTAQNVYVAICKELNLSPSAIYLEGKEFAGVNTTVVLHKTDDLNPVLEEIMFHSKKEGLDRKKLTVIAGVIGIIVVVIIAAVVLLSKPSQENEEKPSGEQPKVEQEQEPEADNSEDTDSEAQDPEVQEPEGTQPEVQEPEDTDSETQDEETTAPSAPESSDSEYVFPTSNTEKLTKEELRNYTKEQLRLGRNEIYARHGMIFGVEDLDNYFAQKSWYQPTWTGSEFYENVEMSLLEEENITLIAEVEREMQ